MRARLVGAWRAWLGKLNEPVVSDRSEDLLAAAVWVSLSLWGLWSVLLGLPTITNATNKGYETVWGLTVFVTAMVAAFAAFSTFLPARSVMTRVKRKRVEFVAVMLLLSFTIVYPGLLLIASAGGDMARVAAFWGSLVYVWVPMWRLRHLWRRMAALRASVAKAAET